MSGKLMSTRRVKPKKLWRTGCSSDSLVHLPENRSISTDTSSRIKKIGRKLLEGNFILVPAFKQNDS